MVDIAIVNSYILFQPYHSEHPDEEGLKKYLIAKYREELVRQLAGPDEYGQPPVFKPPTRQTGEFETVHTPQYTDTKRNCKVCFITTKKELKVR